MSTTTQNGKFTDSAIAHGIAFHKITRRYVMHARDLAKSGQKDAARDWFRYFENAQVLEIVASHNAVETSSVQNLKDELRQLGTECHPMDVADWSTDIQAIRAALEILVQNLPRKKIRTVNLSNSEFPQGSFEASINWRKSHKRSVK
jgi:hypothetical protein